MQQNLISDQNRSKFVKKANLANLKSDVDDLNIDKSKNCSC